MGQRRMVHLTTASGAFHARVIAARLGADGILTELRGATDGPYPVATTVEVLVPEDDLAVARELLLADEVDSAVMPPLPRARARRKTVVVGVAALLAAFAAGRCVADLAR